MPQYRVLFVDDEENILSAVKRIFFKNNDMEIFTAANAGDGLKILKSEDINLVVSDEKMPKVSGSRFLQYVKEKHPDTVRMILTGYSDISSALDAINKGEVYRYLTKPWNDDDLKVTIRKALEFSELKKKNDEMTELINEQNKELNVLNTNLEEKVKERTSQLEKALNSLKDFSKVIKQNFQEMIVLLTGIVSLFQKHLGAHSKRVAQLTGLVCKEMGIDGEEMEAAVSAAYLHDIGLVGTGKGTSDDELIKQHPVTGANLIGSVQNLKNIAAIIRHHHEEYNGRGFPNGLKEDKIPLFARIIKITSDYDDLLFRHGETQQKSLKGIMESANSSYDPDIVKVFSKIIARTIPRQKVSAMRLKIKDLKQGMYMEDEICLKNGVLFIPKGIVLSESIIEKLHACYSMLYVEKEVKIRFT